MNYRYQQTSCINEETNTENKNVYIKKHEKITIRE